MIETALLQTLRGEKNLLAFSAGIDSTALFHLLHEADIPFDIALVNYHTRPHSDAEAAYAQTLAQRTGKRLYLHDAPAITRDFEHQARQIRYNFFEHIIAEHGYSVLLTAHQLNDRLEWLLMQLSRGSGLPEMTGMQRETYRKNYRIVRPLLQHSKEELKNYLDAKQEHYFIDESNHDLSFKRNRFRHAYSDTLIKENLKGIRRSFELLDADSEALIEKVMLRVIKELVIFNRPHSMRSTLFHIDKILKQKGYLATAAQRQEITDTLSCVIGGKFAVVIAPEQVYIAPYRTESMPKPFKEACRKEHIPKLIRPYLYLEGVDPSSLSSASV